MDEKVKAVLKVYGMLSSNKLEDSTSKAFLEEVKASVARAQLLADRIANTLTTGRRQLDVVPGSGSTEAQFEEIPADLVAAKEALVLLAKSVQPVVEHWRPFIEATAALLEVSIDGLLPKGMVPDPTALEKALEKAQLDLAELRGDLEHEQDDNADLLKKLADANARGADLKAATDALELERKRSADLLGENRALKEQLAKAPPTAT